MQCLPASITRVGVVYPDTPEWPKMRWVHEAFIALGLQVERAQTIEEVRQLDRCCDLLVFMQRTSGVGGPNLRDLAPSRRSIWCQWYFDLNDYVPGIPLANNGSVGSCGYVMRLMDVVFVKEKALIDEYKSIGINAVYLDQGVPVNQPECIRPATPRWDVLLWGQGGLRYRQRLYDIRTLADAGFRCAWATSNAACPDSVERLTWCHPDKLHELAGQACCVLSVDLRHDVPGFASDRFWQALGMGCCVLRHQSPGLPEGPYVVYSNPVELVRKTTDLLSHAGGSDCTPVWPPRVLELSHKARLWSMQHHSLANRCRQLLETVRTVTARAV